MEINDFDDIAGAKTMHGDVAGEDGIGEEFKFHGNLVGMRVMNLVCPDKRSFIQIVRMSRTRPFGPVRGQEISKYWPCSVSSVATASQTSTWFRRSSTSLTASEMSYPASLRNPDLSPLASGINR